MERWLLDEPVALYRTETGAPVALEGRCPHHLFPLGRGIVEGDNLRCAYHGMTFAPDGACVTMPTLSRPPAACKVRSYPVIEKWQWLWIWPGDPDLADESLIPDHEEIGLTDPRYRCHPCFHNEVNARYQLLHDNLLDLTHLEFLHNANIGSGGISTAKEDRYDDERSIRSVRVISDIELPPAMKSRYDYQGRVDREFALKFFLPCLHAGYDGYRHAASSHTPGNEMGRVVFFHAVTPARKKTLHYFFARGRDYAQDDDAMTRQALNTLEQVLAEDIFATEQVERMIEQTERPREVIVATDRTLVLGRRLMERMIRADRPAM